MVNDRTIFLLCILIGDNNRLLRGAVISGPNLFTNNIEIMHCLPNKQGSDKGGGQRNGRRASGIHNLIIGCINYQTDKKSTELLSNRIIDRGLSIAHDIYRIRIIVQ